MKFKKVKESFEMVLCPHFLEKLTTIIKIISESTEIKGLSITKMLSEMLENSRSVGKYGKNDFFSLIFRGGRKLFFGSCS